jgi:excisionase family DNA binding protein
MTEPEYVSATEAARRLDITDTAIRKRIKRGTLDAKKVGREWRIPVTALPDSSVTEPNHVDVGSATEPIEPADMPEGPVTEPEPAPESSVTEPPPIETEPSDEDTEPNPFGDRTEPQEDGENPAQSLGLEDVPPVSRYEVEGVEVENEMLRMKLESVEREHLATQQHLTSVLGEIDHLRTVNERLTVAVTNEQILRLGSAAQPDAIESTTVDVDEPVEYSEATPDDYQPAVTIRGSKPRGWLGRLFGSK